ncbi:MAG TPA: DUF819 family protein [Acidobacteriota bacterium]|nr:DUF819 family protein [Acidobacteriota bacterium]
MTLISDPMAVLVFCTGVCAFVFWISNRSWAKKFFSVIPAILFIYYLPTFASTLGLIPTSSPTYDWMRDYLLPFALFLLMVTTDVPTILRIGPKALGMMLAGTLGIVIGGPLALAVFGSWLPEDAWKGLAALSGSWIGGGGNFAAMKEAVGAPDSIIGPIIVVDTAVGYTWMGVLMFLAGYQNRIDRWNGADNTVLNDLNKRLASFQESRSRPTSLEDGCIILALGFAGAVLCRQLGIWFFQLSDPWLRGTVPAVASIFSDFTWTVIFISTLGLGLSFTRLRKIDEAGGSSLGYVGLYLFLTSIGAKADLMGIVQAPMLALTGAVWILVHVVILVLAARLMKAPLFLLAVGSQANVGGAASAPVVAAAYYRAMAPVGLLMGVFGYLIGNYAALLCAFLLRLVAGG